MNAGIRWSRRREVLDPQVSPAIWPSVVTAIDKVKDCIPFSTRAGIARLAIASFRSKVTDELAIHFYCGTNPFPVFYQIQAGYPEADLDSEGMRSNIQTLPPRGTLSWVGEAVRRGLVESEAAGLRGMIAVEVPGLAVMSAAEVMGRSDELGVRVTHGKPD